MAGVLLLGMLLPATAARADSAYLAELLRRADAANLATRREWQTLLHYRPAANGASVISDADDPRFFLAATGKTDPVAELTATLRAFFSTELVGADPQPASCAFIARYRWLQQQLHFDQRRLPTPACERFQQWLDELNPASATLIFASAYLNNPASLFGHTLLRLDQRGQTEQTRLLAYTINYAADDSTSNALTYAVDGIAGGFRGEFRIQPYYQLVRTYSDLESRDIWEYQLNLSPPQLQRLLEHVWELRGIQFDYFFFRENCAWQLLTLLEAADPALRLSEAFTLWALPADTIRLLAQQRDLIGPITARPARGTAIRRRYQALNADERRLTRQLQADPAVTATPEFARLAPERQALLLELALDQRQHQKTDDDQSPVEAIAHALLTARNQWTVAAAPIRIEPYATQPEAGHASRRLGIGVGQRDGSRFVELNARASYHDLLEPEAGYTPDAQIELLSIAVRHYQNGGLKLDRLTLLDITSLPPINALSPRPAWRIHVGWQPAPLPDCRDCAVLNLSGGLGAAAETGWPWRTVWFVLPGLQLDYSGHFADDYRTGFGTTIGALLQPLGNWKVMASISELDYLWGETSSATQWIIEQHWALERDWALRMSWRSFDGAHEFGMGLYGYF